MKHRFYKKKKKQKKTKEGPKSTPKPTLIHNSTNHQSKEGENKTHPNPFFPLIKKAQKYSWNLHPKPTPLATQPQEFFFKKPHWNPFTHQFKIPIFLNKNTPSPLHAPTQLQKQKKK
jgi:hypothetical protein